MEIDKLGQRAEADPANWGFAGSLNEVRSTLIDAVESISGIERARIEETLAEG